MVLGKPPVPERPTIWMIVGQGPIALAVGAGGGCLDVFTLFYPLSPPSPSLWETARYRLENSQSCYTQNNQPTNVTCCFVRVFKGRRYWVTFAAGRPTNLVYSRAWYRLKYCLKRPLNLRQPTKGSSPQLPDGFRQPFSQTLFERTLDFSAVESVTRFYGPLYKSTSSYL